MKWIKLDESHPECCTKVLVLLSVFSSGTEDEKGNQIYHPWISTGEYCPDKYDFPGGFYLHNTPAYLSWKVDSWRKLNDFLPSRRKIEND